MPSVVLMVLVVQCGGDNGEKQLVKNILCENDDEEGKKKDENSQKREAGKEKGVREVDGTQVNNNITRKGK